MPSIRGSSCSATRAPAPSGSRSQFSSATHQVHLNPLFLSFLSFPLDALVARPSATFHSDPFLHIPVLLALSPSDHFVFERSQPTVPGIVERGLEARIPLSLNASFDEIIASLHSSKPKTSRDEKPLSKSPSLVIGLSCITAFEFVCFRVLFLIHCVLHVRLVLFCCCGLLVCSPRLCSVFLQNRPDPTTASCHCGCGADRSLVPSGIECLFNNRCCTASIVIVVNISCYFFSFCTGQPSAASSHCLGALWCRTRWRRSASDSHVPTAFLLAQRPIGKQR